MAMTHMPAHLVRQVRDCVSVLLNAMEVLRRTGGDEAVLAEVIRLSTTQAEVLTHVADKLRDSSHLPDFGRT